MGFLCAPKCGSFCCGECTVGGKPYTLKEPGELYTIEKRLVHKDANWEASYPWIRDPKDLPDNRIATMHMLRSTKDLEGRVIEIAANSSVLT